MKFLYKYPQATYPYAGLVETNRGRSRHEMEYELERFCPTISITGTISG
jgi:hypothetical protein